MSLKACRVGVNPAQVDPVDGSIKTSATGAYSKAEADAKFETKSDATTALAAKQPINLVVPIEMLEGTQLVPKTTVESIFATMNNAMTNAELTDAVKLISIIDAIVSTNIFATDGNILYKVGHMIFPMIKMTGVTASAYDVIATLPSEYRPKKNTRLICVHNAVFGSVDVNANGEIQTVNALTNETITISGCAWII